MSLHEDALSAIKNLRSSMRRSARLARAYQHVWSTPEGQIVFNDLFGISGLLLDRQAPCDPDTRSADAGARGVGIHILQRLRWSEGELVALARQHTADRLAEAETD